MCLHKSLKVNYRERERERQREHKNANKNTYRKDKKSYLQNSSNNKVVKEKFLRQKNCSRIY
jgi:hypothetical protein